MASTDGTSSDAAENAASAARRRARTAAEQREERGSVTDDPDEIAAEIQRTREDLAETIDAIADKVSPKRVADRTKKKVTGTVKDGAEKSAATVKAGASQLKDAVAEKKDSLQEKVGSATGSDSTTETTVPSVIAPAAVLDDQGGSARTTPPPDLHAVPAPTYGSSSTPRLGPPVAAGAAVALLVAFLAYRRRKRNRSRWR